MQKSKRKHANNEKERAKTCQKARKSKQKQAKKARKSEQKRTTSNAVNKIKRQKYALDRFLYGASSVPDENDK